MTPYATVDSPSTLVRYSGRIAATDSDEMSVSMLTTPRAMTTEETLAPVLPAAKVGSGTSERPPRSENEIYIEPSRAGLAVLDRRC